MQQQVSHLYSLIEQESQRKQAAQDGMLVSTRSLDGPICHPKSSASGCTLFPHNQCTCVCCQCGMLVCWGVSASVVSSRWMCVDHVRAGCSMGSVQGIAVHVHPDQAHAPACWWFVTSPCCTLGQVCERSVSPSMHSHGTVKSTQITSDYRVLLAAVPMAQQTIMQTLVHIKLPCSPSVQYSSILMTSFPKSFYPCLSIVLQLLAEAILQHKVLSALQQQLPDQALQQEGSSSSPHQPWLSPLLQGLQHECNSELSQMLKLAVKSSPVLGPAMEVGLPAWRYDSSCSC